MKLFMLTTNWLLTSSKMYYFCNRTDLHCEPIDKVKAPTRLAAAKYFANRKQLSLKDFLKIFKVSK